MSTIPVRLFRGGRVSAFAEGGLAHAARKITGAGRFGDSRVVHVNEREFQQMRKMWGEPHINPKTKLPEYFDFGDIISTVAPAVIGAYSGDIGNAIGVTDLLGSETAANALIGGGGGALSSALMGRNPLMGGAIGAGSGAISANWGDISSGLSDFFKSLGIGSGPDTSSVMTGGDQLSNPYSSGPASSPSSVMTGGDQLPNPYSQVATAPDLSGPTAPSVSAPSESGGALSTLGKKAADKSDFLSKFSTPLLMAAGMTALKALAPKPAAVAPARLPAGYGANLGPATPQVFMRTPISTAGMTNQDWYRFGQRAHPAASGDGSFFTGVNSFKNAAHGGLMSLRGGGDVDPAAAAHQGPGYVGVKEPGGTGRSDGVPAMLSNNEFVQDAETTALLGDGSPEAGARKWEEIRDLIRKKKGKALAKGKFTPKAPSPLELLKEVGV